MIYVITTSTPDQTTATGQHKVIQTLKKLQHKAGVRIIPAPVSPMRLSKFIRDRDLYSGQIFLINFQTF